jgi:hypothetical protein
MSPRSHTYRRVFTGPLALLQKRGYKGAQGFSARFHVTNGTAAAHLICAVFGSVRRVGLKAQRPKKERPMSHVYQLNTAVLHRGQGPQGRVQVEEPKVYTIVQRMPVESDGRLRYRIKSDKVERIVTEDELSYCQ